MITDKQREWVLNNLSTLLKEENLGKYSEDVKNYVLYLREAISESEGFKNLLTSCVKLSEQLTSLQQAIDLRVGLMEREFRETTSLLRRIAEEKKLENFPFFAQVRRAQNSQETSASPKQGEIEA